MTSNTRGGSSGAHQRQSIFRFRSERANWIAVLAIVVTLLLGIFATVYSAAGVRLAEDSKRLAMWEAEKDYQIYCQGLKASHQRMSPDCAQVVDAVLNPPPFHDPSIFIRLLARIRRSLPSLPSTTVVSSRVSSAIWFTVTCGIMGGLGYLIIHADYSTNSDDSELEEMSLATGLKHLAALLLPLVFRSMSLYLWMFLDVTGAAYDLPAQTQGALSAVWVIGHLWSFHTTRKAYAQRRRPVWRQFLLFSCACSALRAWNGFIMAYGQALGPILLRGFDVLCTALYANLDWDGNYWNDSCTEIGPLSRVRVWYLGICFNTALGILFSCHLALGGALLWMTGSPVIELNNVLEPYLLLGRKLLALALLMYFAAWNWDYLVYRRRHKRHGFARRP